MYIINKTKHFQMKQNYFYYFKKISIGTLNNWMRKFGFYDENNHTFYCWLQWRQMRRRLSRWLWFFFLVYLTIYALIIVIIYDYIELMRTLLPLLLVLLLKNKNKKYIFPVKNFFLGGGGYFPKGWVNL